MDKTTLAEWLREDTSRAAWLAKRLNVSYEFVRLMALGRRGIKAKWVPKIEAAMRIRAISDDLLKIKT